MAVSTFDPAQLLISVGGVPISGFADGEFVSITSNNPQFTRVTGADGFTSRVKSNDYSGTMTLTLAQTSPSNDVLSAFLNADRLTNTGVVPVLIKDLNGSSIYFSATAWIQQFPDITYSNEMSNRAWTLELAEIDIFVGGNEAQA